jgi:putative ABC transport system permease protein
VHGLVVGLYPGRIRDRFGRAIEDDFAEALEDAARSGWLRTCRTGVVWCADAAVSAFAERLGMGRGVVQMGTAAPVELGGGWWRRAVLQAGGREVRLALRRLSRQPGLVGVVVLTLGVSIGAATTVFLAIDVLLVRSLAYPAADRLVRLEMSGPGGRIGERVSAADAEDIGRRASAIESLTLVDFGTVSLSDGAGPADVAVSAYASASVFMVLGVGPVHGRGFAAGEDEAGRGDVVVLSDGLWRRRFAADPQVLGRSVLIQGRAHTVIGVLPPGFEDPSSGDAGYADVWLPLAVNDALRSRGARWLIGIARLAPAVTRQEASVEIGAIAAQLAAAYPETNEGMSVRLTPLREAIWGEVRRPLFLMLGATAAVLLIACANLANVFLARGAVRRNEIAVQRAIGAGAGAITRQFLFESLLLALAGGALGLALTYGMSGFAGQLLGGRLPRLASATPDATVLLFAIAISILSALAFGLLPCLQALRSDPSRALESSRSAAGGRERRGARRVLVASQVMLSVVLLGGAAQLIRSMHRLSAVDPGFAAANALAFDLSLPAATYGESWQLIGFHERLGIALAAEPGFVAAGAVDKPPLGTRWGCNGFAIEGERLPERAEDWPCADTRAITQHYLEAAGIPLVRGRAFGDADGEVSANVVLINQTLAASQWPGEDPIGRRIAWAGEHEEADGWRTVVGVVGDVLHRGPMRAPLPEVYMPFRQAPDARMTWIVRTTGDPTALVPVVRRLVAALDPTVPVRQPRAMDEVLAATIGPVRASAIATAAFAAFALLLALVGVHGVLSFLVAHRAPEMGVRMALGATAGEVQRKVLAEGMSTVALATLAGLGLAWALGRTLQRFVFDVGAAEPVVLAGIAAVVLCTGTLACWLPARRAARLDPTAAMRGN